MLSGLVCVLWDWRPYVHVFHIGPAQIFHLELLPNGFACLWPRWLWFQSPEQLGRVSSQLAREKKKTTSTSSAELIILIFSICFGTRLKTIQMDTKIAKLIFNCDRFYLSCVFVLVHSCSLMLFNALFAQRYRSQVLQDPGHPFQRAEEELSLASPNLSAAHRWTNHVLERQSSRLAAALCNWERCQWGNYNKISHEAVPCATDEIASLQFTTTLTVML